MTADIRLSKRNETKARPANDLGQDAQGDLGTFLCVCYFAAFNGHADSRLPKNISSGHQLSVHNR